MIGGVVGLIHPDETVFFIICDELDDGETWVNWTNPRSTCRPYQDRYSGFSVISPRTDSSSQSSLVAPWHGDKSTRSFPKAQLDNGFPGLFAISLLLSPCLAARGRQKKGREAFGPCVGLPPPRPFGRRRDVAAWG